MAWAAYIRTSTVDQHPENQRMELETWLKCRGIENVDWYEERESTRKTRPIKQELLKKLREGQYKGILVWQLTRWARSFPELILELEEFGKKKITFVSIKDLGELDMETTMGRAMVRLLAIFGELERDWIRERTLIGLARAKQEGKQLGRPKGSKDKKLRRKSGYYRRWSGG